jgi:TPR repeat protein
MAANMGHGDAQLELGQLCKDGYIEGKGFLHALKWYTKAYFQENTRAIAHLYLLDGKQGFGKEFYFKLFKKMDKYKDHLEINLSNDGTVELEPRYRQVTGDIFQFYGYVYYQLGYMYFSGNGAEFDFEKAWHHFNISHKVFNTKEALRFMIIGIEEERNLGTPTHLKKIEMFSDLASKLDAKQLYELASVIYNKNRFKHTHEKSTLNQDDKFAFGLLERSVKEGYLNSKKLLGDFYYFGYGVAIDYKKNLQNHIDYANAQDGQENFRAGVEHYDSKKYNSQGWNIALVYITKASNQKNINAQKLLFDTFYSGQNTTPFIKEIEELYKALADQQSDNENIDAGIRYLYRWRNPLAGLVYLHRAADQENPVALRILGDLYCYGNNVDKGHDKAKELQKSSSIQLSSRECFRIGKGYYKGSKLLTKNHEIAFIYLNESITKGNYETGRHLDDTYFPEDVVEIDEVKELQLHEIFAVTPGEDNLIYVGQSYFSKEYYSIAAIYLTKIKRRPNNTSLSR